MGVRPGAVSEILSGLRLIKASEITPSSSTWSSIRCRSWGRVGAGAAIEPETRAGATGRPGESFQLPFSYFRRNHSPRSSRRLHAAEYENGDVIVVYREQRPSLGSFYGEEAAVRVKTGDVISRPSTGKILHPGSTSRVLTPSRSIG